MTTETKIRRTVDGYRMEDGCEGLLIAVSGGPDSMALLHWYLCRDLPFPVYVLHVHHGLREASDAEEKLVRDFCAEHGADCRVRHADVNREREKGESIESAARRIRYEFFFEQARQTGATHLATAHTADDQAETVLLHLIHGAGGKGLGGIAPRREERGVTLIRPLINCPKSDTLSYCKRFCVPYAIDESNRDLTYTRNRIRAEVLPLLRQINPQVTRALCRTADALREQQETIDADAAAFLAAHGDVLPQDRLNRLPPAVRTAVLRRMFADHGKELSAEQTEQLRALLRKRSGTAEIDRKYLACVSKNTFSVTLPRPPLEPTLLHAGSNPLCDGRTLILTPVHGTAPRGTAVIPASPTLIARPRAEGDTIRRGTRKTLKKAMMEAGIPFPERDRLWVIADGTTVLWVERLGADRDARPEDGSGYAVTLKNNEQ